MKIESDKILKPTLKSEFENIPKEYKKVARDLESQFAEYMIEQMNKTSGDSSTSSANKFYQSLLTKERAQMLSNVKDGLGLQKVILDQIYPKELREANARSKQYKIHDQQVGLKNYGERNE